MFLSLIDGIFFIAFLLIPLHCSTFNSFFVHVVKTTTYFGKIFVGLVLDLKLASMMALKQEDLILRKGSDLTSVLRD